MANDLVSVLSDIKHRFPLRSGLLWLCPRTRQRETFSTVKLLIMNDSQMSVR